MAALAFRLRVHNPRLAALMVALLAVQLTLGVLNIVWSLPLAIATAHNGFGAVLLLALVTVNFAPAKSTADARSPAKHTQGVAGLTETGTAS